MKAWLFQDNRQKAKLGDKCPWSVGWFEDGRKRSKTIGCQSMAEKFAQKIENQAEAGVLQTDSRKRWATVPARSGKRRSAPAWSRRASDCTLDAIEHFERIVKPGQVQKIRAQTIDEYCLKAPARKGEEGRKQSFPRNGQQGTAASPGRAPGRLRMGLPAEDAENPHGEGTGEARPVRHPGTLRGDLRRLRCRHSGRNRTSTPRPTGGGGSSSTCT